MTVIGPNNISGINSITAQTSAINFYDSTGATLSIGASVSGNITGNVTGNITGNVNSTGVSTFTTLTVGSGVTISAGIVSATEFRGSGANLTGVEANGALRSVQYYTSSGSHTWTKPAGLKRVRVYVTGGGGGGGNPAANTNNGGGGAGGGTAIKVIDAASLGSTESITVGAGGAAGNPGGTGGTSSFGSHCSATGGVGGASDSQGGYGYIVPGVGSGGDLNIQGCGPDAGRPGGDNGVGGSGGGSFWGGGGRGGFNYNYPHAGAGSHGGGGGGAYRTGAGGAGGGAAGGAGIVVVEEYF